MKDRIEHDSMGEVSVPGDAYFGVHTTRSLHNFKISGQVWHPALIISIAQIKRACALANADLGLITKKKAKAIVKACDEVTAGDFDEHFPLDVYQAGSGTSTNMNANEVIANRACELLGGKRGDRSLVHPNDDVNKGQSTNNVIPSAMRIGALLFVGDLCVSLKDLIKQFKKKATSFKSVIKSGRTHLQDAVPMTLGQEFGAYATALEKHLVRIKESKNYLCFLGVGGNAVGTGVNTHKRFRSLIVKHLNKEIGGFKVTKDGIESTQFLTDMLALSSSLKSCAVDLNKICNDIRLLSSGPKTGLAEINLPAVEPGSSIMPGKINPSICEAVNMVCHKVIGNDTTITLSCTSGNLDLNTHMPVIANTIIESVELLLGACETLGSKCIAGITANKDQCTWYVENSMALATIFNPTIGYDKAAALVKESQATGVPIRELAVSLGYFSEKELAKLLDPKRITSPNL